MDLLAPEMTLERYLAMPEQERKNGGLTVTPSPQHLRDSRTRKTEKKSTPPTTTLSLPVRKSSTEFINMKKQNNSNFLLPILKADAGSFRSGNIK